jgi:hypothetical protein
VTQTKFRANNEVVICDDEGEDGVLLFNPDKDETVLLNATGRKIWAFLAAPHTISEIACLLTASFPKVAPERAAQDAEKFVQALAPDLVITMTETADVDSHADSADSREESKDP